MYHSGQSLKFNIFVFVFLLILSNIVSMCYCCAVNFWNRCHHLSWCIFIAFILQVLFVANPANTNALILKQFAPSIPKKNVTCLTRLDHNRALGQIDERLKIHVSDIKNVIIWGNNSTTQYPDVNHATFTTRNGERLVREHVADDHWYLNISNMFIYYYFHMFKLLGNMGW